MNIKYRESLLAGVIATLMASPGWLAAQQMGDSPAPSGERIRSEPASAEPATNPAAGAIITRGDPLLPALSPLNLKQMDVVDASEEKIGKVEDVVRSREDGHIYAIVSYGGILGIGAKEIPIPLEALQLHGDRLRIVATEDDIRQLPKYQEDQYVELSPSNRPISEFSAFEVTPPPEGAE
jgi:hypothetical protein